MRRDYIMRRYGILKPLREGTGGYEFNARGNGNPARKLTLEKKACAIYNSAGRAGPGRPVRLRTPCVFRSLRRILS